MRWFLLFRRRDEVLPNAGRGNEVAPPERPSPSPTARTIIGAQTKFKGRLKGQGAVIICGTLRGEIDVAGSLTVAPSGRIEGDVDVQSAQLSGQARGTIRAATSVRVEATGQFEGEIATPVIDLRPGSILRGRASIIGRSRRPPTR